MKATANSWMRGRRALCSSSALALLVACGGGSAGAPKAAAGGGEADDGGEASTADASAPQTPQALAQAKFEGLSDAVDKLGEGKAVDAGWLEAELKAVLALDAKHRGARFNLAMVKDRRGDRDEARELLGELYEDAPDFGPVAENVAADLVDKGEIDKAVAIYKGIAEKDPKAVTSRLALARLALRSKNYDDAIELSRQVLQRRADAQEAFRVLAEAYKARGNVPMAELIVARGLKAHKEDTQLQYVLAQILLERGDIPGGVSRLKQIVALEPKWLRVRAQLADIALTYRDFANASQQFEAILKEQPDSRGARLGLGVSYKGMGRFEQAEKLYQEVLKADAKDADALWNLAVLYHRHLAKYDDAIALYRRQKDAAGPGDEQGRQVDGLVNEIEKLKSDVAAQKARAEAERKRQEAIEAACGAIAAKSKPDVEAIGNEQERIEASWQLMVTAQAMVQEAVAAGQGVDQAEAVVQCAWGIAPDSPKARAEACAPMRVMWTQILYQLNRLDEALKTVREGLVCDAGNPDAQLIEQQLVELMTQKGLPVPPKPEAPK